MNAAVREMIRAMEPAFVETLTEWLKVPSVKSEPAPDAPFGTEVRRMYDLAMATGRKLGFKVRGFDGYACDMTLGTAAEQIAVLGHLDVVPAGDGWSVPPFGATRDGDRIISRGSSDDKGPALAAMFAAIAIMDAGIPLKRGIRIILGCDEESGWQDMAYYASKTDMPEMGFSPDASFPLINTEKAQMTFRMTAKTAAEGVQVLEMCTGERTNVIPGESAALLAGGEEIAAAVRAYARKTGLDCRAEVLPEGVRVTAIGIPGHAAYPWGRRNAIGMMLCLLKELGVQGPLRTLADAVGMEYDGKSLGCACRDEISGDLTNNIGILHVKDGELLATLDMRCPVNADLDALSSAVESHLPGFTFAARKRTAAHHVPADGELVSQLLAAYTEVTGKPGKAASTGGGTYAKVLKQGVAFGASFPEDEDLAHQANEYATVSGLMTAMEIYANALLRLCAE